MKYTVCVDFDGVLHRDPGFVSAELIEGDPVPGAIGWLEGLSRRFDVVVLSTRAESIAGKEAIERWLVAHGPLGGIRATATKVPALLYVDDRAWRFTERTPRRSPPAETAIEVLEVPPDHFAARLVAHQPVVRRQVLVATAVVEDPKGRQRIHPLARGRDLDGDVQHAGSLTKERDIRPP